MGPDLMQLNKEDYTVLKEEGIEVVGEITPEFSEILTPAALRFVAKLERKFGATREELLQKRVERQKEIDAGTLPDFLAETQDIRKSDWKIAPIPEDLQDRRVEITGPVDRKMIINALNSGAKVFMADFEDSLSPTWHNVVEGQINLRDAVNRTISLTTPKKEYTLNENLATLLVRPRGWHLVEKHLLVDGKPVSASIFDFSLYFYHNVETLLEKGTGPYFYLPKLENHLEARLWNDIFVMAQNEQGIQQGTIKATVLLETILAAFEMDEILYELREHSSGLNCGRWDYIFSFIKIFRNKPEFVLPDRSLVTMDRHFLHSYVKLLIKTCHRRGAHAMGGMAAQIPIKNDPEANELALQKVKEDKIRESEAGHDGTWVAHPGLIQVAMDAFDSVMPYANQIDVKREDVQDTASDLLQVPGGDITEEGLRKNISIGIQYMESWLRGAGCVPLYYLMEDAATAEISRSQIWQWIKHSTTLTDKKIPVTAELFKTLLEEELGKVKNYVGEERYANGKYELARELFEEIILSEEFVDFLTLSAYNHI